MTICLAMVTKNQAKLLYNCLVDIYDLFDEIIVVNNMSSDNTVEIAQKFNCKIIDSDGNHEMSRNIYIKEALSDWIFVIDTDEIILRDSVIAIRRIIENNPSDVMAFGLPKIEYLGEGTWARTRALRLFRRHHGIYYNKGTVHTSISYSIREFGGVIDDSTITEPIHHLDILYKNKTSLKRNGFIERILNEINSSSSNDIYKLNLYNYIAQEYLSIGDYETAERYIEKAFVINDDYVVKKAHLFRAYLYLVQGKLQESFKSIEILLGMNLDSDYKEKTISLQAEIMLQLNKKEEAIELCRKALIINPYSAHSYINLASLVGETDPKVAIEYLEKALEVNPFLLEPIIYKKGDTPNLFQHQNSFLSCAENVYTQLEKNFKAIGNDDKAIEMRIIHNYIVNNTNHKYSFDL